ncbi:hypothetical protein JT358_08870 [Micrococcales bacterium 31B]|nr:hypothetical protein [Micrococcales bacterium 31B]
MQREITSRHQGRKLGRRASVALVALGASVGAASPALGASETNAQQQAVTYVKYAFSERVFSVTTNATGAQSSQWLTAQEWAAAGRPTPKVVANVPGEVVYRNATSPDVYVNLGGGAGLKLTLSQWVSMGSPKPLELGYSYFRAPGGTTVFRQFSDSDYAVPVSFEQWLRDDAPTPRVDAAAVSAVLVRDAKGDIYRPATRYQPLAGECRSWHHVTWEEWVAMGAPAAGSAKPADAPGCTPMPDGSSAQPGTDASSMWCTRVRCYTNE